MMPLIPTPRCNAHNAFNAINAARSALRLTSLSSTRQFSATGTRERKNTIKAHYEIRDINGPVTLSKFQNHLTKAKGKSFVFRNQVKTDAKPLGFGMETGTPEPQCPPVVLPALGKWFESADSGADFTPYLKQHSTAMLPYEMLLPNADLTSPDNSNLSSFLSWLKTHIDPCYKSLGSLVELELMKNLDLEPGKLGESSTPWSDTRFIRFEAPLALLAAGLHFNNEQATPQQCLTRLYVAQVPLSDLPQELQDDVPTPDLVTQGGNGDVYGSSLWMGLEPTYTPWHRDPNPNLFCQLYSSKVVRIMPPFSGEALFNRVQAKLGLSGSSRIRGHEMMQGAQRRAWLDAVWGKEAPLNGPWCMYQVTVNPSDVLYIPNGWWHSVRSVDQTGENFGGGLNASVNWWFRFTVPGEDDGRPPRRSEWPARDELNEIAHRKLDGLQSRSTPDEGEAPQRRRGLGGKPVNR